MSGSGLGKLARRVAAVVALSVMGTSAFAACTDGLVEIKRPDGSTLSFKAELALTNEEHAQGLMYRTHMDDDAGMLFIYEKVIRAMFWMRNTLLPLDMLFIEADGKITHIHENAIPLDETIIFGGKRVRYVFEINGGLVKKLNIPKGAQMRHSAMQQDKLGWSCAD